jgi:Zn-dependent peptidase ImmA (M78 family)
MGIDIVPVPGLQAGFDVDAYTTSDLKEIHVEEFIYLHRPARYRFSLAHEAGHVWLHADLFRSLKFPSAAEWKRFVSSIPEREYGFLEFHANEFAGHVLVPAADLGSKVAMCRNAVLRNAPDAPRNPDAYREFVAACISREFQVSQAVALKRFDREGIVLE